MQHRTLGNTGLKVSRLGVGLSELGDLRLEDEGIAARVLNTALDNGINFFNTAACYGNSEELFGRSMANRRDEHVLSTKAGHAWSDDNGESWTAETVRGDVIQALQAAKQADKTRYIGYSSGNESTLWAVESGLSASHWTEKCPGWRCYIS